MVRAVSLSQTSGDALQSLFALLRDGWTVVTEDGSLSAHFEDTVAIGASGPEILTRR